MTEGKTRGDLEQQLIERSSRDPHFREQLKQDPRGTVARDFGVEIPQHVTVEVVEETPSRVYVVLPPAPAQSGGELTDQELEAVAGGGWTEQGAGCNSESDVCY